MKKAKFIAMMLFMTMVMSSFSAAPVFAAGTSKELEVGSELGSEGSEYKIIVPNLHGISRVTYEVNGVKMVLDVIIMEAPKKDINGTYPIFEIVTTDKNAYSVESYPGTYTYGVLGNFTGEFKDGRLMYKFSIKGDLARITKNTIFTFDFTVLNKDAKTIFSAEKLNFLFENKRSADTTTKEEPVSAKTAKPTTSKVVVNGKEVAFDAYEIDGSNYFKLRDLAMVINGSEKQFSVGWSEENNAIRLTTNAAYSPAGELGVSKEPSDKDAKPTSSKIYINDKDVQFTAYGINDNNYFKLRDIAKAIGFGVKWNADLNMIEIDTKSTYQD